MNRKVTLTLLVALFVLSMSRTPQAFGYSSDIQLGNTVLWKIESAPDDAFNMFYTGGGDWIADAESMIVFDINAVNDDVGGDLTIGNVSVLANDTEIAKDLTLGVWGTPTQWWPGLIVDISDINTLNSTAYASAERVSGNYLNGTMVSSYETINTMYNEQHQCIVFDFEQDPTGFGEPQRTHLAYSLETGVLIEANTSYSFGVPYELVFTFTGFIVVDTTVVDLTADPTGFIVFSGIVGGGFLGVVVIVYIILSRRN